MYYHFGELPGFNSVSGYDPGNKVTLVIWSNLTVAPDSRPTANALLNKVVDQIYSLPPRADQHADQQADPSTPPTTR